MAVKGKARGKDLGRVEVFKVGAVRRGLDSVTNDFLASQGEDYGLKEVGFALAVLTGGGPRLNTPALLGKPDGVHMIVFWEDDD